MPESTDVFKSAVADSIRSVHGPTRAVADALEKARAGFNADQPRGGDGRWIRIGSIIQTEDGLNLRVESVKNGKVTARDGDGKRYTPKADSVKTVNDVAEPGGEDDMLSAPKKDKAKVKELADQFKALVAEDRKDKTPSDLNEWPAFTERKNDRQQRLLQISNDLTEAKRSSGDQGERGDDPYADKPYADIPKPFQEARVDDAIEAASGEAVEVVDDRGNTHLVVNPRREGGELLGEVDGEEWSVGLRRITDVKGAPASSEPDDLTENESPGGGPATRESPLVDEARSFRANLANEPDLADELDQIDQAIQSGDEDQVKTALRGLQVQLEERGRDDLADLAGEVLALETPEDEGGGDDTSGGGDWPSALDGETMNAGQDAAQSIGMAEPDDFEDADDPEELADQAADVGGHAQDIFGSLANGEDVSRDELDGLQREVSDLEDAAGTGIEPTNFKEIYDAIEEAMKLAKSGSDDSPITVSAAILGGVRAAVKVANGN